MIGEEIYFESLPNFKGVYDNAIDLTDNSKGVYFLEITTNNGNIYEKLIIQ